MSTPQIGPIRFPHHKYNKNIEAQNRRLALEFGYIDTFPKLQWKLTDELFADVTDGFKVLDHLIEGDTPEQNRILHVAVPEEKRITVADVAGRVIWTLAQFRLPFGNAHQQYQSSLNHTGILPTSQLSYVCTPNGDLDDFDWPDENNTDLMILLIKHALNTASEQTKKIREANFKARKKAHEDRRAMIRDWFAHKGAPAVSMANPQHKPKSYSEGFKIQLNTSRAKMTGPVVSA